MVIDVSVSTLCPSVLIDKRPHKLWSETFGLSGDDATTANGRTGRWSLCVPSDGINKQRREHGHLSPFGDVIEGYSHSSVSAMLIRLITH